MKGFPLACALSSALVCASFGGSVQATEQLVTIGTGGQTGVYYLAGQAVCRFLSQGSTKHHIRCSAPTSGGGVANVNGIRNGTLNFALMQADHQFKAMKGLVPFKPYGPMNDLRAIFSLHDEVFTLVARKSAGIASVDDLKGKRVNIGNPGSGQRETFGELMALEGWDNTIFGRVSELRPVEQAKALGIDDIDAMSYFVGHPNAAIQEATTKTDALLVPLSKQEIDQLLASRFYYTRAEIPGGLYRGNPVPISSIGTKAVLSTSNKTDPKLVYQLVKSVFDNLDGFKRLHPAFANLKEADMIKVGLSAPLHEGALRYYKERGWL